MDKNKWLNLTRQKQTLLQVKITGKPAIALTFDDGPHPSYTREKIAILADYHLHATFFVVGRNVQAQCGLTERLIEAGHELANHTMTHPHLAQLAREEEIREEILGLTRLLRQIGWNQDFFFRPPFANMDERVWEILKQHDMLSVTSRHVVGDYRSDLRAEEIYQRQVADLQSGDILLYHCLHSATVTMLPRLLDYLLAHNYDILTLTSLLERGEIPNA